MPIRAAKKISPQMRQAINSMKNILSICAISIAVLFAGCTTTKTGDANSYSIAASILMQVGFSEATREVVSKNKAARPAFEAIATGIDSAITKGEIQPSEIDAFIGSIQTTYGAGLGTDANRIVGLLRAAYTAYAEQTGLKVVITADPRAAAYLNAVKNGIRLGLAQVPSSS